MRYKLFFLFVFNFLLSFFTSAQYVVNGDAVQTAPGCYRLTTTSPFQGGSVWYLNRVDISQSFELYFTIFLGCLDADGADGIAFVLQPISTSIGSAGGGIGYQGISPSLALEIDTWQNQTDPSFDHMALMSNGVVLHNNIDNLAGPVPAIAGQGNIEDCQNHSLKISWDADSMIFRAYVDCDLRITYTGDIVRNIFNNNPNVFWGFTGATGGFVNNQSFCLEYISFTEALSDTAICRGNSVQLSAGTGSNYTWTPSVGLNDTTVARPVATPQTTTTYTVEIEDICNESRFDTIVVQVDTPLVVDLGPDPILCRGDSINLSTRVSYPFPYVWNTGDSSNNIWVSQPGIYQLEVANACGNYTDGVVVTQPPAPILSANSITCKGGTDGSATITSRSIGPFAFQWLDSQGSVLRTNSSGAGTDQISNLTAGSYLAVITDGNGCTDSITFQITEPPLLLPQLLTQTDILCHGDASGEIVLGATGGTPPYQFGLNGQFQPSGVFGSLPAGSYLLTVRDANGCDSSFTVTLSQPDSLFITITEQKNIDSFGNSNGRVRFIGSGGQAPYVFSLNGSAWLAANTLSLLQAGPHVLRIQDNLGCIDSINIFIEEPDPLVLGIDSIQPALCNGDSTGSVRLQGQGGSRAYRYSLDNVNFSLDSLFSGLPAGTFTAYIVDDSACRAQTVVQITEPAALNASIAGVRDVDCRGNSTGAIAVAATGGVSPYQYSTAARPFLPGDTLFGLPAGMYQISVRDSNGCETSLPAQVNEPAQDLTGSIQSQQQVDCFGNANGAVTALATGGTAPYQYSLNGRDFFPDPSFDSLSARPYTVTVRDTNGCIASISAVITSPTGLTSQLVNYRNVACHGDSTGSVTILGSGGAQPYQYSYDGINFFPSAILANIPAGSYNGFLQDDNNCLVAVNFDILEPDPLADSIIWQKNVDCFGALTGAVRYGVSGGVIPYRYSIDSLNFQASIEFRALSAGNYTLTAIDDSGCVVQEPIQITEPPLLATSVAAQANQPCFGDSLAFVRLAAQGGVPGYSYQLDTMAFSVNNVFTDLKAGNYQVVVRDDSACTDTVRINITEPPLLQANLIASKGIACFGDSSGYGVVAVSGGSPGYQYMLNGGPMRTDSLFLDLPAGNYQVIVQDDSLCTDTVDFSLTQSPQLLAHVVETIDIPCHGDQTGGFTLSVQGGIMPYRFDRDGLGFGTDSAFTDLGAGTYLVTVQDDSLCEREFLIELTEPDSLVVVASGTDVLCFGDATGTGLATPSGGVPPYAFNWNSSPGQAQPQALALPAGTYIVTLQDSNLCTDRDTIIIDEPPLLQISLEAWEDAYCDWDNGSALVSATGGISNNYRFLWNSDPPQTEPNAINLPGGLYIAIVTDENGCQDSIPVPIGNTPPADPGFFTAPASPVLLSEAQVQFVNTSTGGVSFTWEFGDGNGSGLENPMHTYDEAGEYQVKLTAFNAYFVCPVDTVLNISIIPDGQLFLANAFSPNSDGYNDIFYVVGEGVVQMEMTIFDRWGRKIALLQSLDEGWNGQTAGGGSAPEGVYTYRLNALFNSGARVNRSGTITLIR